MHLQLRNYTQTCKTIDFEIIYFGSFKLNLWPDAEMPCCEHVGVTLRSSTILKYQKRVCQLPPTLQATLDLSMEISRKDLEAVGFSKHNTF